MAGGYTTKSDMWALGIILYELCYLEKPFLAQSMDQLEDLILHWEPKAQSHQVSASLQLIICHLLRKNPETRPSVKELLSWPIVMKKAEQLKIGIGQIPKAKTKKTTLVAAKSPRVFKPTPRQSSESPSSSRAVTVKVNRSPKSLGRRSTVSLHQQPP